MRTLLIALLTLPALAQPKFNVLFFPVDDLKPIAAHYGGPAITPNMDKFAARGVAFTRAYCQQAVCSPSRTSLMTGRRPDTTKVWDLNTHFRPALPDAVTLSQHFIANGAHAQAAGKIYHPGFDDKPSWSLPNDHKLGRPFFSPQIIADNQKERTERLAKGEKNPAIRGLSFEIAECNDDQLPDGKIANIAIDLLRANKDKRFFIAAGFQKPHLPFVAPKKYFDLYPPESIKLAPNPAAPKDAPKPAIHNSGELRQYRDIPKGNAPIPDAKQKELIRAYLAATSFMDAQLGRVLDELDKLGLRDSTIIVLWGDHGWHLGDHGLWNKHTNFEEATRAPLLVSAPGMKAAGAKCDALVEFVDIFPSLCDLAGLKKPEGLEGHSFAPLLDDPKKPWKPAAFSQYPRANGVMGYTIRTATHRYTEWRDKEGKVTARELYDHTNDPREDVNLANQPEHKATLDALAKQLAAGWKGNGPR